MPDFPGPIPGTPTDASTLIEAIDRLKAMGFTRDMFVTRDAVVRCGSCEHDAAPSELDLHHLIRLEGVSDPADMSAVLGLECRVCGMKGTAVVRYGPEAEPHDVAVLRAIDDQRD